MPAARDCPKTESWQALLQGAIPAEQRERYEQHLETCPACQAHLDRAEPAGDELLQLAQQIGDPTRGPTDATLLQAQEALLQTPSSDWPALVEPADLHFLRPPDRPGILGLLGPYEVWEVIGQGGMGLVLKAFDPQLNRLVAIKVLSPVLAGSATARRRFTREAHAAATVSHNHIVPVHAVQEVDGLPFLVMQFIAGESLQARLDRMGPLEPEEVIRIGQQTASALATAHAQGLIHRDIKPANILLERVEGGEWRVEGKDGDFSSSPSTLHPPLSTRIKITDFGLARLVDDVGLTQNGVIAGTPEYMAPEQARGEPLDHRSDLFSLGSVLYTLCAGVPPFPGAPLTVLRRVCEEEPTPVRTLNPNVPSWLAACIAHLMAKNPADRFQSAAEVAQLLEGYLGHLQQPAAVPAPGLPPVPAVVQPGDRKGNLGRLILLLALLGLGLGLISLLLSGGDSIPQGQAAGLTRRLQGHTGPVHVVRFSRDGKRLISASGWPGRDHGIRIWDLATGQELLRMPTPGNVGCLALTSDDRFALAGMSNGLMALLDLESGRLIQTMQANDQGIAWIAFGPDGKRFFFASADGTARCWDLDQKKELLRVQVSTRRVRSGALFPDGRRLLTGDGGGVVQIWDLNTGQEIKQANPIRTRFIDSVQLLAEGRQALVTGIGGVSLFDVETGKEVRHFQADDPEREEVAQAVLSPDGRRMLTGSFDGKVRLWDFQTGDFLRVVGEQNNFVWSVALSPDGRFAASGGGAERVGGTVVAGSDFDIRLWDLAALPADAPTRPLFGNKGWLGAAVLFFLLTAGLLAGVWFLGRRRQDRKDEASDEPAQDHGARTGPSVILPCAGCGQTLKARAELAGKKVKCPQCGQAMLVPSIPSR